jgi:hypothetical protein
MFGDKRSIGNRGRSLMGLNITVPICGELLILYDVVVTAGLVRSRPSAEKSFQVCQFTISAFGLNLSGAKEIIRYSNPTVQLSIPTMILKAIVSSITHPKLSKGMGKYGSRVRKSKLDQYLQKKQ